MKFFFYLPTAIVIITIASCTKSGVQQSQEINAAQNSNSIAAVKTGILTGSRTGFYLLNAANGNTIWNYRPAAATDAFCSSTACVYGSNVLFNLGDTLYSAAVRTGVIKWAVSFKHFRSAICINNGKAYISSANAMFCVNANNGTVIWKMPFGAGEQPKNQSSSPTVVNGIVYVGGATDKMLYALNASTGAVIWKKIVSEAGLAFRSPTVYNSTVYMQGYDSLFAFDASSGSLQWQKFIPVNGNAFSGPTVANGKLYISSDSLYCLNTVDGSRVWAFRDNSINADCYRDVFVDGNVVYAAFFSVFYKLNAATGVVYPGWGNQSEQPATDFIVSNNLLIHTGDETGTLFANNAANDAAVWNMPLNDRHSTDWCAPISVNSTGEVIYPTVSGMRP